VPIAAKGCRKRLRHKRFAVSLTESCQPPGCAAMLQFRHASAPHRHRNTPPRGAARTRRDHRRRASRELHSEHPACCARWSRSVWAHGDGAAAPARATASRTRRIARAPLRAKPPRSGHTYTRDPLLPGTDRVGGAARLRSTLSPPARLDVNESRSAPKPYTPPPSPRPCAPDDSCAAAAAGVVRAILGRVDASLWTLRALGAEAHLDELRRSLRDLLAVDEGRHA